jgi:hypothetical protein
MVFGSYSSCSDKQLMSRVLDGRVQRCGVPEYDREVIAYALGDSKALFMRSRLACAWEGHQRGFASA